jgi:DNA-binding MarR family transcriptional regulator
MKMPTLPRQAVDDLDTAAEAGTCGVLGQIDDDRLQLMGLIVRTHRHLAYVLGQELERACGIPLSWFDVLIQIGGAPEGRLTMSKLSANIALTTGGVTRLVDRMVEADLLERQHCPSDRRSVHVMLTPKGQATLKEAIAQHIEGLDRHLMAPLDAADRAALRTALGKLVGGDQPAGRS